LLGLQQKMRARDGPVLHIMHDAANGAKDSGIRGNGAEQTTKK